MKHKKWAVGEATVHQVVELEAGEIIQDIIEGATPEAIQDIEWLSPEFADEEGNLEALVQAFLIEVDGKTILVDSCNGNDKPRSDLPEWGDLDTDFISRLEETGNSPEDVDIVTCTHLHMDHVGWNTKLEDDSWVPTFPNAEYLFVRPEYEYWEGKPEDEIADDKAAFDDSVQPVVQAGLSELVTEQHEITGSVSLVPTPGHTPGHVAVKIESEGEKALISGDLLYHPCQIARPNWIAGSDGNPEQAVETRKEMLEELADSDTLLIGSHFPNPAAGKVVKTEEGLKLDIERS